MGSVNKKLVTSYAQSGLRLSLPIRMTCKPHRKVKFEPYELQSGHSFTYWK